MTFAYSDETGIHFDVEKIWNNDIFTVIQRWENKVGREEADKALKDIEDRWKEYKNKIGHDTALKIVSHICGETESTNEAIGKLLRKFLFVEIKGGKLEDYLDKVVNVIQNEEQEREDKLKRHLEKIPEVGTPSQNQEPVSDTQPPADPVKATKRWLINRQYIIKHTESDTPVMLNGAIDHIKPSVLEWRITKTVAFIYRELVSAAKKKESPLAENEVPNFIVNYLRNKNGSEITKNATDKAAKSRQKQPKSV
jgi:hypothetical protein